MTNCIFPKVHFWGEKGIERIWDGHGSIQKEDRGYGFMECLCGVKYYIHLGARGQCPKCGCAYSMTNNTLAVYAGLPQ